MVVVDGTRVIVGVSGSVRSLGALRVGVAEASSTGSTLLAVLAWAPEGGEYAYRRAPCPVLLKQWEHDAHERLRRAFDAAFGGIPGDVTIREMVVRAKPGPLLVEIADRPDDVLVIGCGGWSGPGSVFHGAVTRYCMAHARCPVVAVPPPDLIRELRRRPHRWRPEDFTRRSGSPARPAALGGGRASVTTADSVATADLPAYKGAPYHQPSPPLRKHRVLQRLRLATIIAAGILLVILMGLLLSGSLP